jgi:hypothetical protein
MRGIVPVIPRSIPQSIVVMTYGAYNYFTSAKTTRLILK